MSGVTIDERHGVTVTATGERAAEWRAVFGTETLPVVGPVPAPARLPRLGVVPCYMLDLRAISAEVRERLIGHLAQRFALPAGEIAADLDKLGCPLPADGLSVTARGPRWLPL